jgi:acetyltransferase-like isoleucine patch superfamily enzyme
MTEYLILIGALVWLTLGAWLLDGRVEAGNGTRYHDWRKI